MIALTAAALFTPRTASSNRCCWWKTGHRGSDIAGTAGSSTNCRAVDFGDGILAPGFIDIHIHGGGGHDVMEAGADALPPVERLLAAHGVSSYFPTTVTAPMDATLSALARLADAIEAAERSPAPPRGPAACGRGRWEFILKVRLSATSGAGFILRKIC